jgi:RNA polymerase sigma-70 factor (ECF subfamily)
MDNMVAAFRAGQPDAVRAVYQQYARPVATVARSVVGNDQAMIDDIVQQTFTKAWQAAQSFDGSRELAPWLYAIARRTAIDHVRAERKPTRGDHEPEVEVAVPPASLERTWEAFEVRRAVEQLPPDEREIVHLGHLIGLTHPEIAERLGVPVGTVKSRSHRAHRRLSAALAHLRANGPPEGVTNRSGRADVLWGREQS